MQDDTSDKPVPELLPQPYEVTCVLRGRGRARLDFNADDSAGCQLCKKIDLVSSLLGAHMKEAWPFDGDGKFCAHLAGDEGVQDPTEKVSVSHHRIDVQS